MAAPDVLAVIDALYAAAYDPALWSPFATKLAATFDSQSAQVSLVGPDFIQCLSITPSVTSILPSYLEYFHRFDGWLQAGLVLPRNNVYASNEHMADQDLVRTEWYTDCLAKMDAFYCLGSIIGVESQTEVMLGIHRPRGRPFNDPAELQKLQVLVPHIARATQISRRFAIADSLQVATQSALDQIGQGVLILAADCRPLFVNAAADRIIARQSSGLSVRHGRFELSDTAAANRLAALVADCARTGVHKGEAPGGYLALPVRFGHRPIALLVCPIAAGRAALKTEEPAALIFIHDPGVALPNMAPAYTELLRALYGMTQAEARLAAALANGKQLSDYARSAGVSVHTARTQLKQVLAKTTTAGQAELLRILPRLP